jgi:hypothetical protein
MSQTAMKEKNIRSIVAHATHQNIAFFRSSHLSFLVAIPISMALSPLMTISIMIILMSAAAPAEVNR